MSILTFFGRLHEKTVPYVAGHNYTNGDVVLAIDKVVRRLTGNGTGSSIFSNLEFLYLNAIDLANGATNATKFNQVKLNLIDPRDLDAAFRMVAINNPTVNREGISFNGTNQALDTKLAPSASTKSSLNQVTFGVYCNSTSNKSGAFEMGSTSGSNAWLYSGPRFGGSGGNYAGANDPGFLLNSANANIDGFTCHNRVSSNSILQYRNGVFTFSNTMSSNQRSTRTIYLGGIQRATGDISYHSDRRQIASFFGKLILADLLTLKQIINEFQGDYELAVGLTGGTRKRY